MAERKTDYPTGSENGMSFICNRWVFTGSTGYRVRANDDGTFRVVSYAHTSERVAGSARIRMTEEEAHAFAASLARTVPHPPVVVSAPVQA